MKSTNTSFAALLVLGGVLCLPGVYSAQAGSDYKILATGQAMGTGGIDYVSADSEGRKLYVPRGESVLVFDLDTLKPAGTIPKARARGVAVDPKSHHGFCSSSPVVMWDTKTLETIKTIEVSGRPDGIYFEAETERIYVLSHSAPNVTVIDGKDGSVVGTIDLGGAPEQAASDGHGHLFVCLEDKDSLAVVDVNTMKVTGKYELGGKGGGPAGLGLDAKNGILFAFCHEPATCVVLDAKDGKILTTLPIGKGVDGGGFNPNTMEAFSSQGDGTLTIIKETSPTSFEVAQTVTTKSRAKTCTLDLAKNHIIAITLEPGTPPAAAAPGDATAAAPPPGTKGIATPPPAPRRGGGRGNNGPSMLDIIVVGK